jgi:hypothetical protein
MVDVLRVGTAADWAGYLGAPRLATAARGAQAMRDLSGRITKMASEILDGLDPSSIGRFTNVIKGEPVQAKVDAAAAAHDAEMERKQTEWLRKHNK